MKKILFFTLSFLCYFSLAQVTNEGQPKSWSKTDISELQAVALPTFDLQAIRLEDKVNDARKDIPYRFGYQFDVNYNIHESGQWTTLENGDKIWRMRFTSEGAESMNFILRDFFIPKGATLYLYNQNRTELVGAYTHTQNNMYNTLGTWLVVGDDITMEYYEPKKVAGTGNFTIKNITHGYRTKEGLNKGLNTSGNCNIDVNCPIGADADPLKDTQKKSVAMLISGGSGFCTGALVNNTANDAKPYFLTANHCYSDPSTWSFRFNWISTNTVCTGSTANVSNTDYLTISGATLRARRTASDFCLVEINSAIPSNWDVIWSGWDRATAAPPFVFGIHHPDGDIMKTCRDSNPVSTNYTNGEQVWRINDWEMGVTEGGSSGSPLFNNDGKIIGQLWRGSSACTGNADNGGYDEYGRFHISWDTGGTPTTQLKNWLDPSNSNVVSLGNYPPNVTYTYNVSISTTNVDSEVCGNTISPILKIKNLGTTTITTATIQYYLNSDAPTTINWTGSLATGAEATVNLNPITFSGTSNTFNANVSNPNGQADEFPGNNSSAIPFTTIPKYQSTSLLFTLNPDNYGSETTWTFKDASGTTLYSGGPYTNNVTTQVNQTFNVTTDGCYTFSIIDSYGDGICCNYGSGSYTLKLPDNTVVGTGSNFGSAATHKIGLFQNLGVEDIVTFENSIQVYPNPSKGNYVISIDDVTISNLKFEIYNVNGSLIQQGKITSNQHNIDITDKPSGVYILKVINSNNQFKDIKLIKK